MADFLDYSRQVRPVVMPIKLLQALASVNGLSGKLPTSLLTWVPSGRGNDPRSGYVMFDLAARAYRALHAHALRDGHHLKAVSAPDTYRPYSVQERIFLER